MSDPATAAGLISDLALPDDLASWLGRLIGLSGVPYGYLVPDERMLPPESIRFFRLDTNWIEALADGAFSIGRNLATSTVAGAGASPATVSATMDSAVRAGVHQQALQRSGQARAAALGVTVTGTGLPSVSGFLLRSRLVAAYPGLGVNAYSAVPSAATPLPDPLPILRFERLGRSSDTLICLIEGDAVRFDVHEAPEHLHFGVDAYAYDPAAGTVRASKNVAVFTGTDPVTLEQQPRSVTLDACFRPGSPRAVRGAALAAAVGAANSAQLGYVMTEGVGLVSFTRTT